MPLGVSAHQTPEQEAALEALRDDAPPADDPPPPDGTGDDPPSDAEQVAKPAEGAAADGKPADEGAKPEGQPQPGEKKGDVRQALRAARRGEQKARERAERAERELEELRKKQPAQPPADEDDLSDEDIEALATDFPAVGRLAKRVKTLQAQLKGQSAPQQQAAQAADPEFEPPTLPDNVQGVVDDIPELLEWQNAPDQVGWSMAVAEDAKLKVHPKWKDRPLSDRLAEVARRVAAELGDEPAAGGQPQGDDPKNKQQQSNDPAQIARDRIAGAARRNPQSISQIGGAGGKPNQGSDLSFFMHANEDEALARLMLGE